GTVQRSAMICLASAGVTGLPLLSQITYGVPRFRAAQARSARCPATTQQALRWGGAAFGHLGVADLGELGVVAPGGVSGAVERGAQQGGPGFADGLAFAVGLAGFAGLGGQAHVGLELRPVAEPAG